jgi:hypothetical protein
MRPARSAFKIPSYWARIVNAAVAVTETLVLYTLNRRYGATGTLIGATFPPFAAKEVTEAPVVGE